MRSIPSIPVQIREGAISGDIEKALKFIRLAYSRKEEDLITPNLTTIGLANILRRNTELGRLNLRQVNELTELLFIPEVNLAAGAVIIRYFINNPDEKITLPPASALEVLSVIAIELESFSDEDLIKSANSLR